MLGVAVRMSSELHPRDVQRIWDETNRLRVESRAAGASLRVSAFLEEDEMSWTARSSVAAYGHVVMRVVVGFLFACHGAEKILGAFGGMPPGTGGKAAFLSFIWFAGFLELVGGILILVGLFTRCTAFILSGEMAVAYFMAHFPRGFWPILNGGEPAVLYCFIFLHFAASGAGLFSLDHALWGKSAHEDVAL
jgi:putative oxidoreductase